MRDPACESCDECERPGGGARLICALVLLGVLQLPVALLLAYWIGGGR